MTTAYYGNKKIESKEECKNYPLKAYLFGRLVREKGFIPDFGKDEKKER